MDEDDSQDELINRSTSHSKGKRAALWAISDDSEDVDDESEEGESDSGQEDEDVNGGGDDDDDDDDDEEEEEDGNEEEDDEEEEDDVKAEEGACGGTSTDLAGMSSDEDTERCPICLNSFNSQPVATPENCEHYFCFDCILEWAQNANSCPVDRIAFNSIHLRKCYGGKVKKIITVQKPKKEGQEETVDLDLEQTNCEVCGGSDREDRLLLCDGCDAGYHMECLTPPLDSVPVEEWFCPVCEPNSRQSRGSAEEVSDTDSLPSTARSATSRSQPRAAGPTRAIARTQQSERVRANVNRHRITQARTSQLAPTYLIQSTWLDDTINAVVAGLNTAVYIRDVTPRIPTIRRRKTGRRRKVRRKNTSSAKGKKVNAGSTGVKRKKRKVRRTKSRKKMILRKVPTPRSRIANNLGIVKDKKSSSLPTVYRPSEHTLSNMRADIGAASLSIYGDPFDLDPFVDREDDDQQVRVTSLLEAKRRGISQSALRSHQPVARPVTAGLSRRGMDVPHSGSVVEAAPIPDLLGSILSGQSILLMDSSDVVINRDGSLKATKPITVTPSGLMEGSNKSGSSGDGSSLNSPGMSPNPGDNSLSFHYNGDLAGSSHNSTNRLSSQSSSHLPPSLASSASHSQISPHLDIPVRERPSLLPSCPNRSSLSLGHKGASEVGVPKDSASSSVHHTPGFSTKRSQPKKAPTKPMWVDVSVLPRIPKIKRDADHVTNDYINQGGSSGGNRDSSNRKGSSNSYSLPNIGMNSLSGGKGRQQSVDQHKGQADGQTQRHRADRAGSSAAFSTSFTSSSSTSSHANQPHCSSSSSSSSVSFRINSSGNSWHSRRLSIASSSVSGSSMQECWREKEDEAKKRQLHRDKQMLLASRSLVSKEQQDSNNMYDPFNPTLSDSSSSDEEAESTSLGSTSQHDKHKSKNPSLQGSAESLAQGKHNKVQVKTEPQEIKLSHPAYSQKTTCSMDHVKVEKDSRADMKTEKQTVLHEAKVKKESNLDDTEESERCSDRLGHSLKTEKDYIKPTVHLSLENLKAEKKFKAEERGHCSGTPSTSLLNYKDDPSPSSSASSMKKQKEETKSESKSPSRNVDRKKNTSKVLKEQPSHSSEKDRGSDRDHHASSQREKDKDKGGSSRRSRSRERRRWRANSSSDSSQSSSPERTYRKRRRSTSQSKGNKKRRSRSGSSSSSRERTRRKKNKQRSKERSDDRDGRKQVSKDKRRGQSHSQSPSKSHSRSRTRSRSKDRKQDSSRSKSRSRSRERKKDQIRPPHVSLSSRDKLDSRTEDKSRDMSRSSSRERTKQDKGSQKSSGSSVSCKDTRKVQDKKKGKDIAQSSISDPVAKMNKQELSSSSIISKVKKEERESQPTVTKMKKEVMEKNVKEIKREKQPFDMFEDFPIIKPIKKEEPQTSCFALSPNEDENIKDPVKIESCDMIFKSEPSPLAVCHIPPLSSLSSTTTCVTADSIKDSVSHHHVASVAPVKEENTVSVKQEPPSDSDDDLSVDVMLDNLDYVKSELKEEGEAAVKQEKDVVEGQEEAEPVSTSAGAKSKNQVKRVTWNIQEPEGPQPEKSASKLALYKLKLKQEGARRPSLTVQTSSQRDINRALGDPTQKNAGPVSTASKLDVLHPGESSTAIQGEAEEGDLSRKDKYLKKLHMQERAIEEVKLAIKPFYQRRDINKEEYKEILRKAVQKVCHSKSGEINPVKVGNLVKAYVDKYKHARKHKKGENMEKVPEAQNETVKT